jgi:hypothetical protein
VSGNIMKQVVTETNRKRTVFQLIWRNTCSKGESIVWLEC